MNALKLSSPIRDIAQRTEAVIVGWTARPRMSELEVRPEGIGGSADLSTL